MSNIIERTTVNLKNKIDQISGRKPSKVRLSEPTALSLRRNIKNNLEKAYQRYVDKYNELKNAITTAEVEKAEQEARDSALLDEKAKNERNAKIAEDNLVARMCSAEVAKPRIEKLKLEILKLAGRIGTIGKNFGINVKPNFSNEKKPKALSVPIIYSKTYKGILKNVDVYRLMNEVEINDKSLEPKEEEKKPAKANWRSLFDGVSSNKKEEVTVAMEASKDLDEEEFIPIETKGVSEEELSQRKIIGQLGEELKEVRRLQKSTNGLSSPFSEGLIEREDSLLNMLSNVSGVEKIVKNKKRKIKNKVPNTEFQNLVDQMVGYKEPLTKEEHEEKEKDLQEYYSNPEVNEIIENLRHKDVLFSFNQTDAYNKVMEAERKDNERLASLTVNDDMIVSAEEFRKQNEKAKARELEEERERQLKAKKDEERQFNKMIIEGSKEQAKLLQEQNEKIEIIDGAKEQARILENQNEYIEIIDSANEEAKKINEQNEKIELLIGAEEQAKLLNALYEEEKIIKEGSREQAKLLQAQNEKIEVINGAEEQARMLENRNEYIEIIYSADEEAKRLYEQYEKEQLLEGAKEQAQLLNSLNITIEQKEKNEQEKVREQQAIIEGAKEQAQLLNSLNKKIEQREKEEQEKVREQQAIIEGAKEQARLLENQNQYIEIINSASEEAQKLFNSTRKEAMIDKSMQDDISREIVFSNIADNYVFDGAKEQAMMLNMDNQNLENSNQPIKNEETNNNLSELIKGAEEQAILLNMNNQRVDNDQVTKQASEDNYRELIKGAEEQAKILHALNTEIDSVKNAALEQAKELQEKNERIDLINGAEEQARILENQNEYYEIIDSAKNEAIRIYNSNIRADIVNGAEEQARIIFEKEKQNSYSNNSNYSDNYNTNTNVNINVNDNTDVNANTNVNTNTNVNANTNVNTNTNVKALFEGLNTEMLNNTDRYGMICKPSKAIMLRNYQMDNFIKRIANSKRKSKKEMLTSLKEQLNSNDFDFLRYNENTIQKTRTA